MSVLVTGGAGYIGSHTVSELLAYGEKVVVIDNLTTGHEAAIAVLNVPFYNADIRDSVLLSKILKEHQVDTVVHFAADSLVGESVGNPLKYYRNNVCATTQLLSVLVEEGVRNIVFSSTAAVYGDPEGNPIAEEVQKKPTNPYGATKLAIEQLLHWCHSAYGLSSVILRYFNAAGAHPTFPIGEDHAPETHLIPIVLQTALGQRNTIEIFGTDYPTQDGSCIRDYIHVMDLASAHRLAVNYLRERGGVQAFNLGNGQGFSVREVINAAEVVTGIPLNVRESSRRVGDPAALVASSEAARSVLGWTPQYANLQTIIASAWGWHSIHPYGFSSRDFPSVK